MPHDAISSSVQLQTTLIDPAGQINSTKTRHLQGPCTLKCRQSVVAGHRSVTSRWNYCQSAKDNKSPGRHTRAVVKICSFRSASEQSFVITVGIACLDRQRNLARRTGPGGNFSSSMGGARLRLAGFEDLTAIPSIAINSNDMKGSCARDRGRVNAL